MLVDSRQHGDPTVAIAALVALPVLGVVGARVGGADPWCGALRVNFWGAIAMAATAAIGALFGVAV
jgi:vacuolar iron transporter family protein